MYKVGDVLKRVGPLWDSRWLGAFVIVIFIDEEYMLYRYPSHAISKHSSGHVSKEDFDSFSYP